MSTGFYFGMGGDPLDLDTLTAGGELVTIEEFTEAAIDAGLDKDIINQATK